MSVVALGACDDDARHKSEIVDGAVSSTLDMAQTAKLFAGCATVGPAQRLSNLSGLHE